jgi:Protein of unknown function (DUF998)
MTQSPSITSRPAWSGTGHGYFPPGPATGSARGLLVCGAIAGPLFIVVVLVQALTRPGFDLTRDAASLLDDGSWGWVQAANFIVTGLLLLAAAAGLRRTLRTGPGSRWIPRLLTVTGAGLAGGGVFHPDPSSGFPPGTPQGASAVASWHGVLHMVCGGAAFLALIAVCFVLARRSSVRRQRRTAACSWVAGALCAVGVATGGAPHGSLTLFTGVSIALLWVAFVTARLITGRSLP